jgi:hypothetical protein
MTQKKTQRNKTSNHRSQNALRQTLYSRPSRLPGYHLMIPPSVKHGQGSLLRLTTAVSTLLLGVVRIVTSIEARRHLQARWYVVLFLAGTHLTPSHVEYGERQECIERNTI